MSEIVQNFTLYSLTLIYIILFTNSSLLMYHIRALCVRKKKKINRIHKKSVLSIRFLYYYEKWDDDMLCS